MRRPSTIILLSISQACLPVASEICQPCTAGGCGPDLTCQASAQGAVCAPPGQGVAACSLPEPDAGLDAGLASDAGLHPDAGMSRCPEEGLAGLEWVTSTPAGVCFTRTEITVRQFEPCANPSCADEFTYHPWLSGAQPLCDLGKPGRREHPMNCINEVGAAAFCASIGGRLPTRAEWRAEASANGTRTYPWGDEVADCTRAVMRQGEVSGCGTDDTSVPCSRPSGNSISGLCDMAGNVWELTADLQGTDPVVCGGGLTTTTDPDFLRTDVCVTEPGRHDDHGFRCVTDFVR